MFDKKLIIRLLRGEKYANEEDIKKRHNNFINKYIYIYIYK